MITIKCTYSDGNVITTKFNGTMQDASRYFLNRKFNTGAVKDDLQECISVEPID